MSASSPPSPNEAGGRAPLEHARDGGGHAIGPLLAQHRRGLELFCHLMLGDRASARAAVADAALEACASPDARDPATPVRIWLYRLAFHACSDLEARARSAPERAGPISFEAPDRWTD